MSIEPEYAAFERAYQAGSPQLVWTRLIDDLETPVSAYLKIGHGRPYAFLFESVEGGAWRGRYSIITLNPDPLDLPDGVMTRPSIVAIFDAIAQEIILVTPVRPNGKSPKDAYAAAIERIEAVRRDSRMPTPALVGNGAPEPDSFTSPVSRERYCEIVEKAKDYIRAGDVFQVVPSHRLRAPFTRDPFALYRSLRRSNPSPFLFYLNFGNFQLAGSSPEILVRLRDNKITIRPIAGTRPRGATREEGEANRESLLADPK
ncbi:MAG: chorismate-binding protein, partial [Phenylobacterium sp.]